MNKPHKPLSEVTSYVAKNQHPSVLHNKYMLIF